MASLLIKVYHYTERNTYWTFFLEETLKVETVLGKLVDKLLTKNLTLFVRTKFRLGRRDKILKPSDSLYELLEKYKKKKKSYELYVLVGNARDSQVFARSVDHNMLAPAPPASLDFLDGDTPNPDATPLLPPPSSALPPHPLSLLFSKQKFSFTKVTKGPQ
eukprot:Phypoly_transcript_19034.p1 GENE.Phypoly_transcript_19034~~Phypoly_transcript_19034.p1  ORF type:complete len:161 (+),score=34.43 Phypoly_transcript_19034:175-657(+)